MGGKKKLINEKAGGTGDNTTRLSDMGNGDPGEDEGSQRNPCLPCWINGDGCWREETWRRAGGSGRGSMTRITVRTGLTCIVTGETRHGIPSLGKSWVHEHVGVAAA